MPGLQRLQGGMPERRGHGALKFAFLEKYHQRHRARSEIISLDTSTSRPGAVAHGATCQRVADLRFVRQMLARGLHVTSDGRFPSSRVVMRPWSETQAARGAVSPGCLHALRRDRRWSRQRWIY